MARGGLRFCSAPPAVNHRSVAASLYCHYQHSIILITNTDAFQSLFGRYHDTDIFAHEMILIPSLKLWLKHMINCHI